ncbi:MAG TPA: helix-turn-helix transcriptional regulator [Solirubrobacterales bacterium]
MITPAERFGLLLTSRRLHAAMSQEELARLVGIHRTEISLLERGGRRPRLDTLLQLAAGLETEPAELLTGMRWISGTVEVGGGYELRARTEAPSHA